MSKAEDWSLMPEVKETQQKKEQDGIKGRKLGVTWTDLTVRGISSDASFNENVISQFNIPKQISEGRRGTPVKTILDKSHGCVKPGEMLLVLGRPGAGCTTLLKMLSNRRLGYAEVEGNVRFGSMDYKEAKQYRGQIVMNTEEEIFFPALTVGQTMDFATRMKVPFHLPSGTSSDAEYQHQLKDFLLRSMGISHTHDTKVGNEFVRGVSGGERKRVSIIECLATQGSVYCWDNSTRGLDASTALEYTKAVRAMTDILGLTSIVTLYQAGNGIYDLFDKVLVLDEGKQIYYGSREEARPFMEELGFFCDPSANVADFLTGVTVPTERKILPGFEDRFPRTADEVFAAYDKSPIKQKMITEYDYPDSEAAKHNTQEFAEAISWDKHKSLPKDSPLTVSFMTQVKTCIARQYQIVWGDKATFFIKQISTFLQALIAGSLFYNASEDSSGLFIKGGALFLSLLYNALLAMSEVTDSFSGRPVLAKHRSFALYHPAAFCIAQIAADIPVLLFQITHFSLVVYFMVGLKVTAGAFFTYWVMLFAATMAMTALFRAVGAAFPTFDAASKVSGLMITALIMYNGYMIPKPQMHPWFVWIFWIDPLAYGFEALMGNEFHGKVIDCVSNNLIPNFGPEYTDTAHQACAGVQGALPGATSVDGDTYLATLSYSHSHVWRNFGILWAWWALYVGITIFFTCRWRQMGEGGRTLLIPREQEKNTAHLLKKDEEAQAPEKPANKASSEQGDVNGQLVRNTSVFTWKNLSYTVKTPSGDRLLLDNVQGWVKPGMLGALMGSSGAGKTTLLDVLAQRKTDGTIHGSIQVDGRPLPISFQRSAGYCEQLDVHEPMATVREALEFSALLRQSRDTPREEKLKYVDTIIDLLELHDIEHTLIGRVGAGLSVEQRKRVTIGVELVSKPSILIFLDEPTSGLDGQAAYNTVRFLRKLSEVGQAVLVTIHQPSASLFAQFDTLLLLAKGGKTVYFGDIGENASTIKEYFARYGAPCPTEANPAEHMIDVVSGTLSQGKDWNEVWLNSPEHKKTTEELDQIISDAANSPPGTIDDGHQFAAPMWTQVKLVTQRMNVALFRNTDYVNNKMALHIFTALFNGFSFWMIGDSVSDLQLRLFTVFNFIFVAPGVIAQLQPLFIDRRDIYEAREKKSKMYHWVPFVTGLIVSELPYLIICAVLYFVCWYYTVGFPNEAKYAGSTLFVMLMYEFVYTGIGQFVAAYAPNAVFATLVNPLVIGTLVSFCGVLVPYNQIQAFWRYWIYWMNPFNYLMGSLLTFTTWSTNVRCAELEFAVFDPPANQTCGQYLTAYQAGAGSRTNLTNPDATSACRVCEYRYGSDYLATINLMDYYYGWRDAAIVVIFALSSYCLVYALMKLRTKASKKAE
ncbi:putative Brefeldin A resistance protein [Saccharata proteae CBS 121410]|uniref:Brefeldin A resistance protein n=1 Tax=Saccharata proteae CBS 121410 TaxID=1314787 RepID=A0A9P4I0H9_9PEZI|nr:putative Brefeldin A resistance protein [Saccharata proteae CBS 121410]